MSERHPHQAELCEWDPARNAAAINDGRQCGNEVTLSIGAGMKNWHLCAGCAALPTFKRFRRRDPLRAAPVSRDEGERT